MPPAHASSTSPAVHSGVDGLASCVNDEQSCRGSMPCSVGAAVAGLGAGAGFKRRRCSTRTPAADARATSTPVLSWPLSENTHASACARHSPPWSTPCMVQHEHKNPAFMNSTDRGMGKTHRSTVPASGASCPAASFSAKRCALSKHAKYTARPNMPYGRSSASCAHGDKYMPPPPSARDAATSKWRRVLYGWGITKPPRRMLCAAPCVVPWYSTTSRTGNCMLSAMAADRGATVQSHTPPCTRKAGTPRNSLAVHHMYALVCLLRCSLKWRRRVTYATRVRPTPMCCAENAASVGNTRKSCRPCRAPDRLSSALYLGKCSCFWP